MEKNISYQKVILFTVLILFFLRLFFINLIPLTGDEAYYWQWARHLAPGYYEQGPVLALIIWFFTFFGKINTEFTVRLGAVILSSLTMWVMYLTHIKTFGKSEKKGALLAVIFANSSVIFSIGSVLMMHDTVMIFFLALYLYNLIYINENPLSYSRWIISGLLLALATMSKYTAGAAYIASLIYFIFFYKENRPFKGLLIMTAAYIFGCTPVIYWNIINDWASLKYLLIRGASSYSFPFKNTFELLLSQVFLFSVFLLFPVIKGIKESFDSPSKNSNMLLIVSLFMFLPFIMLSISSKIEANWPAFALYPLFFFAANYASSFSLKKTFFKYAFPGIIIVLLIHIQAAAGFIKLPPKIDPMHKIKGYKETALKASEIYDKLSEKHPVFCATRHYQTASLFSFYMKNNPMVYCILKHESNKNYRFWNEYKQLKNSYALFFYTDDWELWEAMELFKEMHQCGEIRGNYRAFNYCLFYGYKGSK